MFVTDVNSRQISSPKPHKRANLLRRVNAPHERYERKMTKPLTGLRVLELARILAGPWAGQVLADLGADVIKVERAGSGDDTRGWGPPFVEGAGGNHVGSAYFHATNRGKRSIEMDFESDEGRRIVRKLAARSDVLIENFKVGGLAKFGLDYKSLAPECPRLIYCSVTGFGQDGPNAKRAGYDLMAQGIGGIMDLTGMADGEPTRVGIPVSDIFTGVYSVIGILSNQAMNFLVSGKVPKRIGNAHANIVPYQVFPVSDGHVIVATGNDNQFVKFCNVLGAPELGQNPDYKDNVGRLKHRKELIGKLSTLTAHMKRDELLEKLEAQQVPAGPINDLEQVFNDPQVVHRGMKLSLPNKAAKGGTIPGVRTPIVIDGWKAASEHPSPRLGQHTAEILREIGEG